MEYIEKCSYKLRWIAFIYTKGRVQGKEAREREYVCVCVCVRACACACVRGCVPAEVISLVTVVLSPLATVY